MRPDISESHPTQKSELSTAAASGCRIRWAIFREKVGDDPFRKLAIDDTVLWIAPIIQAGDFGWFALASVGRRPSGDGLAQPFQQSFEFCLAMLHPPHAVPQLPDVVSQPCL